MYSILLRGTAIVFQIIMSVVLTFSFIAYSSLKKIKFVKSFFLGILAYILKFIFIVCVFYSLMEKILDSMNLSGEQFLATNKLFFILYLFINSIYMVLVRVLVFKFFFKKNRICFYDAVSFAVGFCTLYNFMNCTYFCLKNFSLLLNIRARTIFIFSPRFMFR